MALLLLLAGNASAWTGPTGNNTWLITGRVPTLVDAGVGAAGHLEALHTALEGADLAQLLITHGHRDHASGADAIRARWPRVRVRRWEIGGLADGVRLEAGDGTLEVLHTPGHSPDHCCFRAEQTGEIFCGDLIRLGGTVVIPASRGGDLLAYLASLRRIDDLKAPRLLPGHGPVIQDPAGAIAAYVIHRAQRDAEILEALRAGCRDRQAIVRRVYRQLAPALEQAAADTVLAHLLKLRAEGRARGSDDDWTYVS